MRIWLATLLWLGSAALAVLSCRNGGETSPGESGSAKKDHGHDQAQDHGDEHETEHPDTVSISPAAVERSGIVIDEVVRGPLGDGVKIPAEVIAEPDRVVHIAPLVEGQITEVKVSVGDRVEKDRVLAVLRSVTLGETRAALAEAQAALDVARANHERQKELVDEGIGARRDLVEAEGALKTARARVQGLVDRTRVYGPGGSGSTTLLRSPIAGEVVQRHATVGEVVRPDQALFIVTDTSNVWVRGSVYPQDISAIRPEMPATFSLSDMPGQRFSGSLDWVSPVMNETTRTLPVRMVLKNESGQLRPGMFGTLRVARDDVADALTVVDTAVEEIEGRNVVFVPAETVGTFQVQPVTTGRRGASNVEVLSGLEVGQKYVAVGTFVLKSKLLSGSLGHGHAH